MKSRESFVTDSATGLLNDVVRLARLWLFEGRRFRRWSSVSTSEASWHHAEANLLKHSTARDCVFGPMAPVPQMLATLLVAASCSTALAQLRGLSAHKNETNATDQTALRSAWGSCQLYGCPSTYMKRQVCQCNSRCHDYNDCCSDIASCSAPRDDAWVPIFLSKSADKNEANATQHKALRSAWGSCRQYGCPSTYRKSQACQCNSRCHNYNNCCSDIASCSAGASRPVGWIGWVPIYKSAGQPGPSNSTP